MTTTSENSRAAVRIIRRRALPAVVGYSLSSVYEMITRGEFPRPIPLGRRAVGWIETDIVAWQATRIAARDKHLDLRPETIQAWAHQYIDALAEAVAIAGRPGTSRDRVGELVRQAQARALANIRRAAVSAGHDGDEAVNAVITAAAATSDSAPRTAA